MRKLHINNQTWLYSVGDSFVTIKSPTDKRYNVWITNITGEDWGFIERARRKKYWKGVRPQQIKNYIENLKCNPPTTHMW